VVNVATPLLPLGLSVPVPIVVLPPSTNVTVPVGVDADALFGETVAVKVTAWPITLGLADDATVIVTVILLTTFCINDAGPLPAKLLSPL
jgi:hypothetical protein